MALWRRHVASADFELLDTLGREGFDGGGTTVGKIVLWLAAIVAFITTIALAFALFQTWKRPDGCWPSLDQLKLFLNAYRVIVIGVVLVLIPQVLQEGRDYFERFKESRVRYSQAKTSVIYLPEMVSSMTFVEAVAAVQSAHEKLHLAETYRKELTKHLSWHLHPKTWADRNYWELRAVKEVLHKNVNRWSQMSASERLKEMDDALRIVEEYFGQDNEDWWLIKHRPKVQNAQRRICKFLKIRLPNQPDIQMEDLLRGRVVPFLPAKGRVRGTLDES